MNPTPMREIPGERFVQLRQHLIAEAERADRSRRPDRRLLLVAAAAALVVATAALVATLTGTDTASAAEIRAKIAAGQRTPLTISGTYLVRSRDPGTPPRGRTGCLNCRPIVPLPSRFVLGTDGSYASITMPPSPKRDIAFDAKTGVETSFLNGVLIGVRLYVRATNVDPAAQVVTSEGLLATWVRRALDRRDPTVADTTFEGRSAWKLTLDFGASDDPLRTSYGARVEIVVDRETGLVLQVTQYAFTPGRWTSIETINDLKVGRQTTAADFTIKPPSGVKTVSHDYGFRRVSVDQVPQLAGYPALLPTETGGRPLADFAVARASTDRYASLRQGAPVRRSVVSARYGPPTDSITVSTYRGATTDLMLLVQDTGAETIHLTGALAGAAAFVSTSSLDAGRVAAFHDGLLIVVTAPTPDEAVDAANSLQSR